MYYGGVHGGRVSGCGATCCGQGGCPSARHLRGYEGRGAREESTRTHIGTRTSTQKGRERYYRERRGGEGAHGSVLALHRAARDSLYDKVSVVYVC